MANSQQILRRSSLIPPLDALIPASMSRNNSPSSSPSRTGNPNRVNSNMTESPLKKPVSSLPSSPLATKSYPRGVKGGSYLLFTVNFETFFPFTVILLLLLLTVAERYFPRFDKGGHENTNMINYIPYKIKNTKEMKIQNTKIYITNIQNECVYSSLKN